MKKFLIATAALASVALVAPANAADLPVKAPPLVMPALYNWSGVYIGVIGGGIAGQTTNWIDLEVDEIGNDVGHPLHGGFVGGEVGFNWQMPGSRWVLGLEGDWSWGRIEEALTCDPDDLAFSCGSRLQSIATARGRIGYAFGPTGSFLAYITGGGVWARESYLIKGMLVTNFGSFEEFKTVPGWTVGVGAEYGITPWLTLKAEVLYVDLAGRDFNVGSLDCADSTLDCDPAHIKHNFVAARVGLNWLFNWGKGKGPVPVVARY